MEFKEFKELVVKEAKNRNIDLYELYYSAEESTDVAMFNGEINSFTSSLLGGAAFRCIINGRVGAAYSQELSEEMAKSLVERAYENALTLEKEEEAFFAEGGASYETYESVDMPELSETELIKAASDANEALKQSHEKITDRCQTEAVTGTQKVFLANSHGVDLSWESTIDMLLMEAVVEDQGETNNDYEMKAADPRTLDLNALAVKIADKAAAKIGSDKAPTGTVPVIFTGDAMCSLLMTFSTAFSAENARKGLSVLAGKEGETVASELVTVTDDPFYEKNPARRNFDGEGSPAYRKNVIEKGVLNTLLYDLSSAKAAGKKTTGNASRASYDSPVGIRPFTFVLQPGELTEEELFEKCGNGVLIDSLGGLHAGANPINGDFSLQSSGFMIENGKKGAPVRSFTVSGNFFDMLKKIIALSDEVKIPRAGSLTAFASPAVLVEELAISGK
ncbi:MAG: TldD/PmbA family protein [Lachnospiraceae bacterium]|nr:TldD/PmbA family protein [Lachnospiraceae bacterium]